MSNGQQRPREVCSGCRTQNVVIADLFARTIEQLVDDIHQRMKPEYGSQNSLVDAHECISAKSVRTFMNEYLLKLLIIEPDQKRRWKQHDWPQATNSHGYFHLV